MAKNPKRAPRSSFSGTARQMEQIDSWAQEKGMGFSSFLHAAAAHYVQNDEVAGASDHPLKELASQQDQTIKKLDEILLTQAPPHSSKDKTLKHDVAENDAETIFKILEDQVSFIKMRLTDIHTKVKRELPDRKSGKYQFQHLRPKLRQLPAMEINLILLDVVRNELSVTLKKTTAQMVTDSLTQK